MLTIEQDHTLCRNCEQRPANERYLECDVCLAHAAALRVEKLRNTWKNGVAALNEGLSKTRPNGEPVRLGDIFDKIFEI